LNIIKNVLSNNQGELLEEMQCNIYYHGSIAVESHENKKQVLEKGYEKSKDGAGQLPNYLPCCTAMLLQFPLKN